MRFHRCLFIFVIAISIFAVKLGFPGEEVFIRGDKTGVGVDTTDSPEAIFEVKSTEDGILIPRLTIDQRDDILSPPNGLMIYNTDCLIFNFYNGSNWVPFPTLAGVTVGPITGSTTVCEGATSVAYSIPDVEEATGYSWTLPDGASISSGSGTRSIEVDWGTEGGRLCVFANTPCGSQSYCIIVEVTDAPVGGAVTGGGTIDLGDPTPTLTLSGHSGTIDRWQRRLDGGSWADISHTATTYSETPISAGIWDYRAVIAGAGCPDAFSDYATVTVESSVVGDSIVFTYSGSIQTWSVPSGVSSITIEAWGAQGGGSYGGRGARMRGTFSVSPGDGLKILVGGQGITSGWLMSGGGGSFVSTDTNTPLVVAGGGGGADLSGTNQNGTTSEAGQDGYAPSYSSASGGTGGNGGNSTGGTGHGGGGGGFTTSGSGTSAGTAFILGGAGGVGSGGDARINGGFGGGGGAVHNYTGSQYWGGGAGGGYSGGGASCASGAGATQRAGGGGSYNSGTDQSNSSGIRTGNGRVVIRW